jgi:hypothetical protein
MRAGEHFTKARVTAAQTKAGNRPDRGRLFIGTTRRLANIQSNSSTSINGHISKTPVGPLRARAASSPSSGGLWHFVFSSCRRRLHPQNTPAQAEGADRTETCATPFALVLQDEGPADDYGLPASRTTGGGPCVIRPIVMGPVRTSVIRVMSLIRFTLMTICNLPTWEYSRDKPGTRGSKRL